MISYHYYYQFNISVRKLYHSDHLIEKIFQYQKTISYPTVEELSTYCNVQMYYFEQRSLSNIKQGTFNF